MSTEVALICGIDPSKEAASGVFAYTTGLARSLAKNGVRVRFIGIGGAGELESQGVEFTAVQERPTTSLDFLLSLVKAAPAINLSQDAVLHVQRADDLAPFCISHARNPKVVTLHGAHSESVRATKGDVVGQIYDQIEAFSLKRAGRTICVSKANLLHFQQKYPELSTRMRLVYAGLDTDRFRPMRKDDAREKLGIKRDAKILLYAGRFVEEKRIGLILKAFKEVESGDKEALLVLVGAGRDEEALKQIATSLSLERIIWRPVAARTEMSLLLAAADATIIASSQEGLPTIAMESLACGTPVVSTPVGIVPEIVKDGVNGYIVSELEALPEIMEKALVTSSSLSVNCAESVRRFSWESVVKEVMAVYDEASAEG